MEGRIVWVTGGASGIGAATVESLVRRGARVGVLDVARLSPGTGAEFAECDLADPRAVAAGVSALEGRAGPPDALVHCAGTTGSAPLGGYPDELWNRIVSVNLHGTFHIVRAVFGGMCERGFGRIVLFSSDSATRPIAGQAAYAATKAGIEALAKVIAVEGGPHGVTCNVVAPGITDTPMTRRHWTRQEMEEVVADSPIANVQRTVVEAQDVAEAATFLCTPGSGRITGQVLHVNGGALMP